jgi:hypothetical protein
MYSWQKVFDIANPVCHELFLPNWDPHEEKHTTADDDKCHFNGKMGFHDTAGFKPSQFAWENRRGFVFHTLVFIASGIPLGLEAGHVTDSSTSFNAYLVSLLNNLHLANVLVDSQIFPIMLSILAICTWIKNFFVTMCFHQGPILVQALGIHDYPFTYEQN